MCRIKCANCKKNCLNLNSFDIEETHLTCKYCKHENDEFYVSKAVSQMKKIETFLERNKSKCNESENSESIIKPALELVKQSEDYLDMNENIYCIKLLEFLHEIYVRAEEFQKSIEISKIHLLESYK
jgi:hypothetical protein